MSGRPLNVEDLLARLADRSRAELDLVRDLTEAIRRADDQLLKEVRSVTMLHEIRRDAIFSELQHLASRLCALPAPAPVQHSIDHALERPVEIEATLVDEQPAGPIEPTQVGRPADWRQAAQRIDEELQLYFNGAEPRH